MSVHGKNSVSYLDIKQRRLEKMKMIIGHEHTTKIITNKWRIPGLGNAVVDWYTKQNWGHEPILDTNMDYK